MYILLIKKVINNTIENMKPDQLIDKLKFLFKEISTTFTSFKINTSDKRNTIISKYKTKTPTTIFLQDENILMDVFLMNSLRKIIDKLNITLSDIPSKALVDKCVEFYDRFNSNDLKMSLINLDTNIPNDINDYEFYQEIVFDWSRATTEYFTNQFNKIKEFISLVVVNKEIIKSLDPVNKYQPFGILDRGLLKTPLKSKDIILLMYHHRSRIGNYNLIPDRFFKSGVRDEFGNKFHSKKDSIRTAIDRLKKNNSGIMPTPTNYALGFSDSFIKSKDIILLMYHHRSRIGNYNLIPDRFFKSGVRDEFGNKFHSKKR